MYSTAEQRSRERVQALADHLYRDHHGRLLAIARRNAANEADAAEALQDAFVSFIEHFDPSVEAPPLAWLTLTLKRRCWAIYRLRHLDRSVGQEAEPGGEGPGAVIDAVPSWASGPAELIVQVDEARAKLAALKLQELRALSQLAEGYSYAEIGQMNQWTYTKTNRCISEGHAALRQMPAT